MALTDLDMYEMNVLQCCSTPNYRPKHVNETWKICYCTFFLAKMIGD